MPIVVGSSQGALPELALAHAVSEAKLRDLPIVLVGHVAMPRNETASNAYPAQHNQVEAAVRARAERLAAENDIRCSAYVPPSPASAGDAVLRAAAEFGAELIVVGVPRRSPVGKAVLGSDSQDILLEADCAVLGVKLPEGEE